MALMRSQTIIASFIPLKAWLNKYMQSRPRRAFFPKAEDYLSGFDFPKQYRSVERSVRFFNGTLDIHHRQYHEDERLDDAYREPRSEVRKRLKNSA